MQRIPKEICIIKAESPHPWLFEPSPLQFGEGKGVRREKERIKSGKEQLRKGQTVSLERLQEEIDNLKPATYNLQPPIPPIPPLFTFSFSLISIASRHN
jgi:hypothetical protein